MYFIIYYGYFFDTSPSYDINRVMPLRENQNFSLKKNKYNSGKMTASIVLHDLYNMSAIILIYYFYYSDIICIIKSQDS